MSDMEPVEEIAEQPAEEPAEAPKAVVDDEDGDLPEAHGEYIEGPQEVEDAE